jgi:hypothetical protein
MGKRQRWRVRTGRVGVAVAIVATVLALAPPTAQAKTVDACPGPDSYGIEKVNATTGKADFTCAYTRSSGKLSVKPWSSKTWSTFAEYGYWRQARDRWRQSSAIWYSEASSITSYTITGNNSSATDTRKFAVNVLWTAPADYIPGKSNGSIGGNYYSINANSGQSAYLDPRWTRSELQRASDGSDRIYAEPTYRARYTVEDAVQEWPNHVSEYCGYVLYGYITPVGGTIADDCSFLACDAPKPVGSTLPPFCPSAVMLAKSAGPEVGTSSETDPVTSPSGTLFREVAGSLASGATLSCPPGMVPLFAEAAAITDRDDAPDPVVTLTADGATITPQAGFADVLAGLQLRCRPRGAALVREGDVVYGTEHDDRVSTREDRVLAFLGLGHDRMTSRGSNVVILGGPGNDHITAHGNEATVRGGPGDDVIMANGADSLIIGGPGRDRLHGAPNAVTLINAKDGQGGDQVFCRSSKNKVMADEGDVLRGPCTRV